MIIYNNFKSVLSMFNLNLSAFFLNIVGGRWSNKGDPLDPNHWIMISVDLTYDLMDVSIFSGLATEVLNATC